MIDPAIMSDIRSRINPQYQDIIGTESYERKLLVDEIDRLNDCSANCPIFHDNVIELRQQTAREIIQFIVDKGTIECGKDDPYFVVQDDLETLREKYGVEY